MKDQEHSHLGDGVYAMNQSGSAVVLKANSHKDPTDEIYLETTVIYELVMFALKAGVIDPEFLINKLQQASK